jgi:hypothetical protein
MYYSSTSGGRSVGIVRLRTKSVEVIFMYLQTAITVNFINFVICIINIVQQVESNIG